MANGDKKSTLATKWMQMRGYLLTALVTVLVMLSAQRLAHMNVQAFVKAFVRFIQEHYDQIEKLLTLMALALAWKQFADARAHKKELGSISKIQNESAGNIAMSVTNINQSVQLVKDHLDGIRANIQETQREVGILRSQAESLTDAVRRLPAFVRAFSRQTTAMHTRILPALDRIDHSADMLILRADIEELIRFLLSDIAHFAYVYDGRNDARYAANVMMFIPRCKTDLSNPFPKVDQAAIRTFIPEPFGLNYLKGILVLVEELSVVAQPEGAIRAVKDDNSARVIFGIPEAAREERRWKVFPGAPLAFVKWGEIFSQDGADLREAVQGHDDLTRLSECNQEAVNGEEFEIPREALKATVEFYQSSRHGEQVKSFLSFPLADNKFGMPFAVLNLHCDRKVFLGVEGRDPADRQQRQQIFAGMITPVVFQLADVVKRWWEISKDKYC